MGRELDVDNLSAEDKAWLESWNGSRDPVGYTSPNSPTAQFPEAAVAQRFDGPADGSSTDSGRASGGSDSGQYDMTVEELQHELRNRDLPVSGNKAELQDRLREDDLSNA